MIKPTEAAIRKFVGFVFGVYKEYERILPVDWIKKWIRLPSGENESEDGPVSFDSRPYLKDPLNDLVDPEVQDIIWAGPTRAGKTFILRMAWCFVVCALKLPSLWYDPTIDTARALSQKELLPLIHHNKVLRKRLPADRHSFTNTKILFPAAPFQMFGANSTASAAGATAAVVFGNEIDKYRGKTAKEASIVELIPHRTESYDDLRKHLLSSTPTRENAGIWIQFLKGDQRYWNVVCPSCETEQNLVWDQVHWSKDAKRSDGSWDYRKVKASAYYQCCGCDETFDQVSLRDLIKDGRWIPTAEGEPGVRSYNLNGLYGPLKVNEMGSLAVAFLSARRAGFWSDLQDFWNSRMGLPWLDNPSTLTAKKFAALEGEFFRGEIPDGFKPDLIIIGADVQTWGLPYVVEVFTWDGQYRTIDHGVAATFADLENVQTDYWEYAPERRLIIDISFHDRGVETKEAILRNLKRGWIAAEGQDFSVEVVKLERANVWIGGKEQKLEVKIPKLLISTYHFKVDLEKTIAGEMPYWKTYTLPLVVTDEEKREQAEFYEQLLCERRVKRERQLKGKPEFEFRKRHDRNHYWDCKVYIRGEFYLLQKSKSARRKKRRRGVKVSG